MQHECRPLAKGLLHIEHPRRQLLGELVCLLEYISTVHRSLLKYIKIHDCRRSLTLTCIRVSVSVSSADNMIVIEVCQAIILHQILVRKTTLNIFIWSHIRSVFGLFFDHDSAFMQNRLFK